MAMTLTQLAQVERNPLRKGIITGLLEESYVMQKIPWENIGAFSTQLVLWDQLPNSVGFRNLNEGFGEGTGTFRQKQESVYDLGTDIDVDLLLTKSANTLIDPRAVQTKMQLKSISYFFNDAFINGDRSTTTYAKGFDGLKVRIDNAHADLTARYGSSYYQPVVTDADASPYSGINISLSNVANAATSAGKMLSAIDDLLYSLDAHDADMFFCNDQFIRSFAYVLRDAKLLTTTKDLFGREFMAYKGIPFVNLGVKQDQTTRVIPTTSNKTTLYAVKFEVGEYLHGIQMAPLDTRDIGELPDKPVLRTRLQWTFGLANWHLRSAGYLKNVQVSG